MEETNTVTVTQEASLSPILTVRSIKVGKHTFELFILMCLAIFSFQDVNVEEVRFAEKKLEEIATKALVESKRAFIAEREKAFALFSLTKNSSAHGKTVSINNLYREIEDSFNYNILLNLPNNLYPKDLANLFDKGIVRYALAEQEKSSIPASIQLALIIIKSKKGTLVYKNDIFDEGDRAFASYKDAFRSNSLAIQDTEMVDMLNANGNNMNEWIFTVSETEEECALLKKAIEEYQLDLLDF
ncbi:hypothetical protein R9C00_13235 [Flammeovirgaceae bacterium SG7u.111]|nr:hypothetical protein [Flammeovirgaceae bacterium SG7u.132]WPO38420.1 hypothetical protein R9C00_13235 [Flammeovirgaceae bacterium SG7u.111]